MDLQLTKERYVHVGFKLRFLASLALLISAPFILFSPEKIEKLLISITKKKELASLTQAENARGAICFVSKKCRNQDRCLKRSIATTMLLALQGKRVSWCSGYCMDPFRAHAWIEVYGRPVGEPKEVRSFVKVIKTPDETEIPKDFEMEDNEKKLDDIQNNNEVHVKIRDLFALIADKKAYFVLVMFLGIAASICTLIQPNLLSDIINNVGSGITKSPKLYALIGVILASTIITTLQYYILQLISEEAVFRSRKDLISHIFQLPIANYSKWSSGDLISRMTGDTAKIRAGIIQTTVALSSGLLLAIGASIGLLLKDVTLFLVTMISIIASFILIALMSVIIQRASYDAQKSMGKLSGKLGQSIRGIRTIRSTNETKNEMEKTIDEAENVRSLSLKLAKYQALMTPVSNLGLQICGMAVIGIGGWRVTNGLMTIADLTSFVLLLYIAIAPFQQIFTTLSTLADSIGSLKRIKEINSMPLEDQFDIVVDNKKMSNDYAISFENVTFSYVQHILGQETEEFDENIILRDVSFSINNGECVAIVGPSGAGKSTVLQLIERFYDLNNGTICVCGQDYHTMSREELRNKITYIEQNAPLLSGTIYDNLKIGNKNVTEEKCMEALEKVNLSYLVTQRSKGLYSVIDENGTGLSGGEKQRLAMARALLSDSDIIILDELTSNLDSINERIIKEVVDELRGKKTIIMVAHRLSTTMNADNIYVLEHGRIVGKGNHDELINTVPLYYELAKEQLLVS